MKIAYKNKQFLIQILKIVIVLGAFYFIYKELTNPKLNWEEFLILFNKNKSIFGISFILFLSFLNRFLEILKWQNLAQVVQPISVSESTKQVLAALTLGVFTPVGVGEYAGKALYFDKSKTKDIIFLNLLCNGIQMVATAIFGIIGLWAISCQLSVISCRLLLFILISLSIAFFLLSFFLKKVKIKGHSLQDFISKINEIPKKIHQKNILLGFARYLVFTHQFYFLLIGFDVNLPYYQAFATITTVYLLSSIVPSFQFLDFALKGSFSLYFFNLLGVNSWIIVFITSLMWLLNVALPVIFGSYFVLKFKISDEKL